MEAPLDTTRKGGGTARALILAFLAALPTGAQETGSGELLAADSFRKLHELIKPQMGREWHWAEVPWILSLEEGRRKGAEQGKPIFVFSMAGDPLGQC